MQFVFERFSLFVLCIHFTDQVIGAGRKTISQFCNQIMLFIVIHESAFAGFKIEAEHAFIVFYFIDFYQAHLSGSGRVGAAAGYASGETEYGLSLNKLWGVENGGSYGYCVNNKSAMSLADTISDGDYVSAYCYSDLTAWSDVYSWFDIDTTEITVGGELALALSYAGFDENWNPVTLFAADAVITMNGEKTSYTTDAQGKVTIVFDKPGEYVLSAVSDSQTLVPPVCRVTVSAAPEADGETSAPATGNSTNSIAAVTTIALAAAFLTKKNEK